MTFPSMIFPFYWPPYTSACDPLVNHDILLYTMLQLHAIGIYYSHRVDYYLYRKKGANVALVVWGLLLSLKWSRRLKIAATALQQCYKPDRAQAILILGGLES